MYLYLLAFIFILLIIFAAYLPEIIDIMSFERRISPTPSIWDKLISRLKNLPASRKTIEEQTPLNRLIQAREILIQEKYNLSQKKGKKKGKKTRKKLKEINSTLKQIDRLIACGGDIEIYNRTYRMPDNKPEYKILPEAGEDTDEA